MSKHVVVAVHTRSDNTLVAVYKHQTRRCPHASAAAALTFFFLFCDVSECMQSTGLPIFLFRRLFMPFWLQVHSLQNITEDFSLWFLLLTGAVQAQRENRQSSYVCLSTRKGREAFISRHLLRRRYGSVVTVVKFR